MAIGGSLGVFVLIIAMAIGAGIGAMVGAIALPLKILDGSIVDAPESIRTIFDNDRDQI